MRGVFVLLVTALSIALAVNTPLGVPYDEDSSFDVSILRINEGEHLGREIPNVDVILGNGQKKKLWEIIGEEPAIIVFAYYTCDASCPVLAGNISKALESIKDRDFTFITLSFDEKDTLETMRSFKEKLKYIPDNWVFGLLSKQDIRRITEATGFRFFYSVKDKAFVHPNVLIFISPDKRIVRYIYGVKPDPKAVRIALAEANTGELKINEVVDLVYLACFSYNAKKGSYMVNPVMILGGVGFVLLGSTLLLSIFYGKLYGRKEV